jgi:hypothetical protein
MKRKAPEVAIGSAEAFILERAYNLIEHMQQLKLSTTQEQVTSLANTIHYDLQSLGDMLRVVKEEIKVVQQMEPTSKQATVEQQDAGA